ncbi:MAG: D-glycero-beta-D-manno-heptose-7-phosphate kinase [Proteobacteria bacterium]|nr:D-glycero-beta-D-manno-heptose-7-phosphate kinase [Pseudomonadota bacterium]NBY20440.1 D-glycero-beta-D-manno-heptose-7-phosphate kinase [bacterium]
MDLSFLKDISQAHLLVAGEVGIDEYLWGDCRRISPEAPVPVVEVESQSFKLGLSANVAQNLASLGTKTTLLSVKGADSDGIKLGEMLKEAGISKVEFVEDASRPTLRKVRVLAQKQHVVRVDYERSHPLDAKLAKNFVERICDLLPSADGIIVQDYGKGIWNPDTMAFVQHAKSLKKPVFVDPSRMSPLELYQGMTLSTPNIVEAETLCRIPSGKSRLVGKDDAALTKMARQILDITGSEHSIITCGEWGMVSLSRGQDSLNRIPTFAREVFDVTGAGDTVIAVLSLMYVLGQSLSDCMKVANAAAGIVVGRIGASSVTIDELRTELERLLKAGLMN